MDYFGLGRTNRFCSFSFFILECLSAGSHVCMHACIPKTFSSHEDDDLIHNLLKFNVSAKVLFNLFLNKQYIVCRFYYYYYKTADISYKDN